MSESLPRVTVGIPCYEHFKAEMAISLIQALLRCPYELHLTVQRGVYLDVSREACVEAALAVQSDYLMFIDTDIQFPADGIERLIARNKDVIGAPYNEKRLPQVSTVKLSDGNGGFASTTVNLPTDAFPCAAVGTGFMAVNLKRMVAHLQPPYFSYMNVENRFMGEDVAFCTRARSAGLEVWADPTIRLAHYGEIAY